MGAVVNYLRSTLQDTVRLWNEFWFRPADPAALGLMRILGGAMLFYTHLVWSLDLEAFFGPHGWLAPNAVELVQQRTYTWSYFWLFSSPAALWTVHIAALLVFALLTVGLFTRVASILALVATLSYIGRVPGALFGLDQINLVIAISLAVGRSGNAYSLDRRFFGTRGSGDAEADRARPSVSTNIAIRLAQLHMCVIYAFAGTSKLMGPSWWDGTAMWQAFANLEYQSLDMTWLAHRPRVVNVMTHVTVLWEVYYCVLIWPRRTRPWMLLLAVPLHLGIGICLGMMTFGLAMLIGNVAFIPPPVVRAMLAWRPEFLARQMTQGAQNADAVDADPSQQRRARKSRVQRR